MRARHELSMIKVAAFPAEALTRLVKLRFSLEMWSTSSGDLFNYSFSVQHRKASIMFAFGLDIRLRWPLLSESQDKTGYIGCCY